MSVKITASPDEPTLAEESTRLLLQLACWLALYAFGLFLSVASATGFYQAGAMIVTMVGVYYCAVTGLQLYRINKLMRSLNNQNL